MAAEALEGITIETSSSVPATGEDVDTPELSIVIPALNEELTIGDFVDWCKTGIAQAK